MRWKVVSQATLQLASFASTLTLARLLTPRDFGLAGLALVFAGLAFLLGDLGLGASLVQRPRVTEADRSTAFWTNAGLGLALTLAGLGLSWPLADLYRQPRVQPLFAVLSLTFLLTALGTTQGALLIRSLSFRSLELRTIVATSLSVALGITLAALGYGPWAIIAQTLANAGFSTALLWRSSSWRPRLVYSSASLRHLLGYGGWIFGSGFITYFERNVDNFVIGRFRGPCGPGRVRGRLQHRARPDPEDRAARRAGVLPCAFTDPGVRPGEGGLVTDEPDPRCRGVACARGRRDRRTDFIVVVLGEKWRPAIRVLQILAWVGLVQVGSVLTSTLLRAIGRAEILFRYTLASAVFSIGAFAFGVHWGIVGVAVGYAVVNTALVPAYVALAARAVGLPLRELGRAVSGVAQATTAMALVVLGLRLALIDHLSAGPRLAVLVVVGIAVYVPLCRARAPEVAEEIRRIRASPPGRAGADRET